MSSLDHDLFHLAKFFEKRGHRVVKTRSAYWCEIHPFCFQNLPFHLPVTPAPEELDQLFHKKLAILVRYTSREKTEVIPGFHWVCDNREYGLRCLEHRFRNRVSRGLRMTEVRPVDFQFLAEHGLELIFEVAQRQGRNPDIANQASWMKYCQAAASCPNFDAHGVFAEDRLVAFLVGAKVGECYFSLLQASKTNYLSHCPNNALLYTIIRAKFEDPEITVFSHGLSSIEQLDTLDKFKAGMGLRQERINYKLVFNPYCQWMQRKFFISSLDRISNYFPKNNFFRKASALLRQVQQENTLLVHQV